MVTMQTIQVFKNELEHLFKSLEVIEHQVTKHELEIKLLKEELVKMIDA